MTISMISRLASFVSMRKWPSLRPGLLKYGAMYALHYCVDGEHKYSHDASIAFSESRRESSPGNGAASAKISIWLADIIGKQTAILGR